MTDFSTLIPLSPMRKVIAARTVSAWREIPHFRLTVDVGVDALLDLRRELQKNESTLDVSVTACLIKSCAMALMDKPEINLLWSEDGLRQQKTADIAVVTAVENGVSTPIIWGAEWKSLSEISRAIRDLAARAKEHRLKTSEIVGGSFTVSNLGMFGVHQFDAIVNPPQCAILSVGAARSRVVVRSDDQIRVAKLITLTLSCDHRAIDGATGAAFLSALRKRIEQPEHLRTGDIRSAETVNAI
jgi:pyruvate dehydrogenase E2 component (dihydrolipoamide acetyltransferase)